MGVKKEKGSIGERITPSSAVYDRVKKDWEL